MPILELPLTKAEILHAFDRHVTVTEKLLLDVEGEHPDYRSHEWRASPPDTDQILPIPEHHLYWNHYPVAKILNVKEVVLGDGTKVKLERRW